MWHDPIPKAVVAFLVVWIGWNIAGFTVPTADGRPSVSFPKAAHRNGYGAYIASFSPSHNDFVVYEAIRRHFRGGHLIGFDQGAIAFGEHSFNGPARQTIVHYDPTLTPEETRILVERAIVRRPPAKDVPAAVVVAPARPTEREAVLVLRGADGTRFFVAGSMAPSRYFGIAHGR